MRTGRFRSCTIGIYYIAARGDRWYIAVLYCCSGNTSGDERSKGASCCAVVVGARRMGWNKRARREETRAAREDDPPNIANVSIRMLFVFFVSRGSVCGTTTPVEGVPPAWKNDGGAVPMARGWRTLIYRGNRSLFLSRRLSRPSPFDRYRLVIAFRYLNISAYWNLSGEISGVLASCVPSMLSIRCCSLRVIMRFKWCW